MRMFRLAEAIPGIASRGLPTNLNVPDQSSSPTGTSAPATQPGGPAGPVNLVPATGATAESATVNVPEPATIALLGLGSLGALLTRRWRRQA